MTPGKYEPDWYYLTYTFAKSKFLVTVKLMNGALVTPTPGICVTEAVFIITKWCPMALENSVMIGSGIGLLPVSVPNHYLTQCWLIVNWSHGNKLHWNFIQNFSFNKMHLEMMSENVGHFVKPQCVLCVLLTHCLLKGTYAWHADLTDVTVVWAGCIENCRISNIQSSMTFCWFHQTFEKKILSG